MPNYSPQKQTIGQLLSFTTPLIVVPDWQRNYSWTKKEFEVFWHDLIAFESEFPGDSIKEHEYFLGSIVLVKKDGYFELLDGQQRLSTATILLSVVRDHLSGYRDGEASLATSRDYIVTEDHYSGDRTYKLTMGRYDMDFFKRYVQDQTEVTVPRPSPRLLSHKLIRAARNYFDRQFSEKYRAVQSEIEAHRWALRIKDILTNRMVAVVIESSDTKGAAAAFETLNDRGVDLSTPDLLHTLLLRRSNESDQNEINESWATTLQLQNHVDEFLRHWWLSSYGDLTGIKLYDALKNKVNDGELTPIVLTRRIGEAADTYLALLECRDENPEMKILLSDIKDLGAKLLYPVLLSAYSTGYEAERMPIAASLISLFVRYNAIGRLEGTWLEPRIYGIAMHMRENEALEHITRIQELAPDDEKFRSDFRTAVVPRQLTARYLLRKIETANRTGELQVQGSSRVHVEHIYPQNPPESQRWDNHDAAVNRLGNLTLLSRVLNQRIKNAPFAEKKKSYMESDISITKELGNYDSWGMESIELRQGRFADRALAIWAFPRQDSAP